MKNKEHRVIKRAALFDRAGVGSASE